MGIRGEAGRCVAEFADVAYSKDYAAAAPGNASFPEQLDAALDFASDVHRWEPSRFDMVKELQVAPRNHGKVNLMWDRVIKGFVAVKTMPNHWIRNSPSEFVAKHPQETEWPWLDIIYRRFLDSAGYRYGCRILAVLRDDEQTAVVNQWATEGDLFSWSLRFASNTPCSFEEKEALIRPLAAQLAQAVQQLHDFGLVHRDVSMENILVNKHKDTLTLNVIDFGMASTQRQFSNLVRPGLGKLAYAAPEMHTGEYDAFLSDAFAVGVTLYCVLVQDYPWSTTAPGICKRFEFARKHGLRNYFNKRLVQPSGLTVGASLSEPVLQLLSGLLAFEPDQRLTLGERHWLSDGIGRRSVWDEEWLCDGPCAESNVVDCPRVDARPSLSFPDATSLKLQSAPLGHDAILGA